MVVNLTRGLDGKADAARHVMKLNYTPLQSGVDPVEPENLIAPLGKPVGVFQLHGQLAPVVWAAAQERPGVKIGYVQSGGGALPGVPPAPADWIVEHPIPFLEALVRRRRAVHQSMHPYPEFPERTKPSFFSAKARFF